MRSFPSSFPVARVSALLASLALPLLTHGALLFSEPFAYPDGALVTVSSGAWSTHSGTTGEVGVVSGRVDLQVPATEDVNRLLPGQPYPSTTNVFLYASFTVNFSALPSAS